MKYNFEEITLRLQVSSRGGGIEIDLSSLGFEGEKMTAYQNYLGGGMLGRVCSDCTNNEVTFWLCNPELSEIREALKKYFHSLTNPDESKWESSSYEANQKRSVSAY